MASASSTPLFLLLLLTGLSAQAQSIPHALLGSGGASMSDGTVTLSGSLGQAVVGTVATASTMHGVGFWYVAVPPAETSTSVDPASELPDAYRLDANYPNPFNPRTTIPYALPDAAHVRLTIYDVLGRAVQVLIDEQQAAGHHEAIFSAQALPSGLYVYRLRAGDFEQSRSMLLLK